MNTSANFQPKTRTGESGWGGGGVGLQTRSALAVEALMLSLLSLLFFCYAMLLFFSLFFFCYTMRTMSDRKRSSQCQHTMARPSPVLRASLEARATTLPYFNT